MALAADEDEAGDVDGSEGAAEKKEAGVKLDSEVDAHSGTSGSHVMRTWYRYAADAMNKQRLNHDCRRSRAVAPEEVLGAMIVELR